LLTGIGRQPSKGRDLGLETRLEPGECRLIQSDAAFALGRGAGLIDRRRSGRFRLIPLILGEVHDFAGDLRAVVAVCITPRLLAAMIIGS